MTFATITIVKATIAPARAFWGVGDGFALGALLILFALCFCAMLRLKGTTLRAPAVWALVSTASLLLVAIQPSMSDASRFAAAATTLCPIMAVLGAKRPQDKGWQWVVATLWLVLVWPAGQALLMHSGELQLFAAWKLFLAALIALGPLNYLPTGYWLASLLMAAGQIALVINFLRDVSDESTEWPFPVAAACLLLAAAIVVWRTRDTRDSAPGKQSLHAYSAQWLRFRDAYGAFWALRILGRVNETAELRHWPMRLTWQGLEIADNASPTSEQLAELDQTLQTLLRRFC